MKLWSNSFMDGEPIPARYAFGKIDPKTQVTLSDNVNPHLAWNDVPAGTQSFAIICHDYDVPSKGDDVNQAGKQVPADLPVVDYFPRPEAGWGGITRWLGRSAAEVVRSGVGEAMSLDGLVSLWHAQQPM